MQAGLLTITLEMLYGLSEWGMEKENSRIFIGGEANMTFIFDFVFTRKVILDRGLQLQRWKGKARAITKLIY